MKKFLDWGIQKGLAHAAEKTQLPLEGLGDLVKPLANSALTSLGIQAVEIDPIFFTIGKIVYAGMERQKKIDLANAQIKANVRGNDNQ